MMKVVRLHLPLLGLILLIRSLLCGAEDWELTCPTSCECKWYNNRRVAVCVDTGFATIPSRLSGDIQVLDLTSNNIQSLGKSVFKMENLINLHVLVLAKNKIQDVHPDAFSSLRLLMDLDLSDNRIEKLHPKTFTGMEKMRKLILDGNFLSRLEGYQFPELPLLQHLLINNCRLYYVNTLAFANLKQLTTIELKGNKLKVLDPGLFMSRPHLRSVRLDDNPWVCDCNLRKLVYWIQKEKKGEAELACHSPKLVAGKRWMVLDESKDLACAPVVFIPRQKIPISLGGNATLACGAKGIPPPTVQWILESRVLTNSTELRYPPLDSEPHVRFFIMENTVEEVYWTNLTVVQIGDHFMLHDYDQSSPFRCKVENPAELVENNITLVLGTVRESPIITGSNLDVYIIIAVSVVGILVLILIILVVTCFFRKRTRPRPEVVKVNGTDKANFMERNNILIVNPVEKPPRKIEQYEKLPSADIELTDLTKGTHKNFEEMNYPEERGGRVRSPLTPLEEEEFDQISQKLLNESLNTTTTLDYALQYPDLLDNVKFPRAVSPTQLSYHSLINPMYSPNPEWRYSYVYPSEYTPTRYNTSFPSSQLPVQPQRPGYVTLPRRPRTASVPSGAMLSAPSASSSKKVDPVYDTLGPRTTADGTSRTDLTRPMSRSMIDPYNLPTPLSPVSPLSLPLRYVSVGDCDRGEISHLVQQTTLPRSAAEILDEQGLSLPSYSSYCTDHEPQSNPSVTLNGFSSSYKERSPSNATIAKSSPITKPVHTAKPISSLQERDPSSSNESEKLSRSSPSSCESSAAVKKKVPPKPPPKPVGKRLSVSSNASDAASHKSSFGSGPTLNFQDEGPDGTEV